MLLSITHNVGGMKSVGLRCSNLSKYRNVCNVLKRSINHGCPTVLYRVLTPVIQSLKNIFKKSELFLYFIWYIQLIVLNLVHV